jgi:hypothetical protein
MAPVGICYSHVTIPAASRAISVRIRSVRTSASSRSRFSSDCRRATPRSCAAASAAVSSDSALASLRLSSASLDFSLLMADLPRIVDGARGADVSRMKIRCLYNACYRMQQSRPCCGFRSKLRFVLVINPAGWRSRPSPCGGYATLCSLRAICCGESFASIASASKRSPE